MRALVIEDDVDLRRQVPEILRGEGIVGAVAGHADPGIHMSRAVKIRMG